MVRLKTRWLLVRIEADEIAPSRKELASAIRDNLLQCFGVAAAGAAYETQGARVVLFFTNHEYYVLLTRNRFLLLPLSLAASTTSAMVRFRDAFGADSRPASIFVPQSGRR